MPRANKIPSVRSARPNRQIRETNAINEDGLKSPHRPQFGYQAKLRQAIAGTRADIKPGYWTEKSRRRNAFREVTETGTGKQSNNNITTEQQVEANRQ